MVRPRFDPNKPLVAARSFVYDGKQYHKGDDFAPEGKTMLQRKTMYGGRYVNHPDPNAVPAATPEQVTMKEAGGGFYDVSAPWLEQPERIRGKDPAQARVDELKAAGPPLGFIEGGSEVTVEEAEGGKFEVTAPWLEQPEAFDDRNAAEARQRELHGLGEPDYHHGVRLTDGGNGWFEVKPDWGETENVEGAELAREAATALREAGPPPEEPTLEPGQQVTVELDGNALNGLQATILEINDGVAKLESGEGDQKQTGEAPVANLKPVTASSDSGPTDDGAAANGGGSENTPPPPPAQ